MKQAMIFLAIGVLIILAAARASWSQVPSSMTVQGISSSTGTVISGTATITLNGSSVYSSQFSTTTDSRGIFNLQLTGLSSATFLATGAYSLLLDVAGTTTTIPFQTSPFAYRAAMADIATGLSGAALLQSTQTFTGSDTFSNTAATFTVSQASISFQNAQAEFDGGRGQTGY